MRNNNYVGVTLNRLNVLVLHDLILVGSVNTTSALMLPPLSDMEVGAGHCEGRGWVLWGWGTVRWRVCKHSSL